MSDHDSVSSHPDAVAIIGLSGRFPGASSIDELWENLAAGRECITRFSEQELLTAGVPKELVQDRNYVRARPAVERPDWFDAEFFGYSAREAERIDPQQRLFLECAWEALEDAGYDPGAYRGWIGVFGAASINSYLLHHLGGSRERFEQADGLELLVASEKDYLATRVAYKLDLRGPALGVQSACSSSLVAVHQACQAIISGQCDMALAGGASLSFPDRVGYLAQPEGVESPDGRCRPFDAAANGTVFGDAVGVVLLKRLEDAIRDRDPVRAVILGSAVNNDGGQKLSYTAPSVDGQARVISLAQAAAGVEPDSIGYVEAHGTGTPLGDPIEVTALTRAFRRKTQRVGFCALGSVKSNLGHTNSAAGVVSLIKATLAIEHAQIPPTLHVATPNPKAQLERSPFVLNGELRAWNGATRRAGVSSFGIGGTNVHAILEQAPTQSRRSALPEREQLLVLSARSPEALRALAERLARQLELRPELELCDVAHTLQFGRRAFAYRHALLARDGKAAQAALRTPFLPVKCLPTARVVFLFTGQGTQYPGVAAELYEREPVFREAVERAACALRPHLQADIRELLWPSVLSEAESAAAERRLSQMMWAQPAVFAIEYALAELLASHEITPVAVLGHSLGEIAAACVAGVFTLEQAAELVTARGRWMEAEAGGGMLSVPLDASELEPELGPELSVATSNAPGACVVAGDDAPLLELARRLEQRGVSAKRLNIPCAAHSPRMARAAERLRALLAGFQLSAPKIPFFSSLTADYVSTAELTSPAYWSNQLLCPVRFSDAITRLGADPELVFLELGPGKTLCTLTELHGASFLGRAIPTLPGAKPPEDAQRSLLAALGGLWQRGVPLAFRGCGAADGVRVRLPSYPFERKRHCAAAPRPEPRAQAGREPRPFAEWFSLPTLRPVTRPRPSARPTLTEHVVLLRRMDCPLGPALERELREDGHSVCRVTLPLEDTSFGFEHETWPLQQLATRLSEREIPLQQLVLCLTAPAPSAHADSELWQLLELARGLAALPPGARSLCVVTSGALADGQSERLIPGRVALTGACRSLAFDIPGLSCRLLDVRVPEQEDLRQILARRVLSELGVAAAEAIVALRDEVCLVPSLEPIELRAALDGSRLERGGVYLISGAFSGIGRELARHLAQHWHARLILIGRAAPAGQPRTLHAVERERLLAELAQAGTEVCALAADVTIEAELRAAIAQGVQRFGRIDGAFHAAGVIAEGLLANKTRARLEAVMAPKIRGSELLSALLAAHSAKFLVLFSSTLGLSGGPGQTEYSAANQYLAGFAEARSTPEFELIAVHWDAWEQVGIAARKGLVRAAPPVAGAAEPGGPPFDREQALSASEHVFEKRLVLAEQWLLSEHRLQGEGVLPGTAYVSLARAALNALNAGAACELRELRFERPCVVLDGQELCLRLETSVSEEGWDLRFFSDNAQSPERQLVATARARCSTPALSSDSASAELRAEWARFRERALPFDSSSLYRAVNDSGVVAWGPRWDCLRELYADGDRVLGRLALAPHFAGDLEHHAYHPALLDVATALATVGAPEGVYLPVGYERIALLGPLADGALWSRVERRPSGSSARELCCDIVIADEAGRRLVEIEGFRLKHVPQPKTRARTFGIDPELGLAALEAILCHSGFRQIVVSPRDLAAALRGAPLGVRRAVEMPSLATDPAAPHSPDQIARCVTEIWRELLGLAEADQHASFFELGGHSLLALQLQLRIRQELGVQLALRDFFRAATLARLIAQVVALREQALPLAIGERLPRAAEQATYPLTPAQRRIFFLQQLAPGSTEYNNPTLLRIRGPISEPKLRQAVTRLIERHESLRTSYRVNDAEPVQQIHEQVELDLHSHTVSLEQLAVAIEDSVRPFALDRAPLVRVTALWLSERDVTLLFDVHHIAADGLSMERLGRELLTLLEGTELAPLESRYRDYVAWLAREHAAPEHEQRRHYWLELFRELPAPLELPFDFARSVGAAHTADTCSFELGNERSAALRRLAVERGLTPFLVLLGLHSAFLGRLSGQEDLVIGTPTAGRRHPAVHDLVGMFVSTLPLRCHPRRTLRFNQLLAELAETTLAAQDQQDYPFEELIALLDLPRELDRNPLFDAFFAFQEAGLLGQTLRTQDAALELQIDIPPARDAKFDLTLRVLEHAEHFACAFEYRRALFERGTVERLRDHWLYVTDQLLANPELPLSELELALPEERATIARWNQRESQFPAGTVLDTFRAQCRRTPEARAVSDELEALSYAELEARAAQLALELGARGLGPGQIAAVLLDRSVTMSVALWAVLWTGAAYLPLDARYPDARLRLLLEDSEPCLLLADEANLSRAQRLGFPGPVLNANAVASRPASAPVLGAEPAPATAGDLAYVIYTSGSTGKPKGVLIEHGSLVNRLSWMQEQFPLSASDVILQKTPYTFDVSVWELFLWAFSGASLHFLPPAAERDPAQIARAISERQVTTLHFVPPMLGAFLEYLDGLSVEQERGLLPLRYVFASGEALTQHHAESFNQQLRGAGTRLINLYGPTEATIDVSYHEVASEDVPRNIPIGRAIDNTGLFVVNAAGRLQPPGIPGELWITGVGVARGYLRRPELTAEKFVPHPFVSGQRAYRSGDIARYLASGELQFIGRIDQQIKLRGQRIETSEIEATLCDIEGVRAAVVLLETGAAPRLLGYYVAEHSLSEAQVRARLSATLPDYMVPSALRRLDALPLGASGKLDRRALPEPHERGAKSSSPPSTERERLIQGVFIELLPKSNAELGVDDDFFELGGDSIKAILLSSRLRKRGLWLEVADIFRRPTIRALARQARSAETGEPSQAAEAAAEYAPFSLLRPEDRARLADTGQLAVLSDAYPLPATHEQVLAQNILAQSRGLALHCYELALSGEVDAGALEQAWRAVLARHDVLRSAFLWRRVSQPLQLVHKELDLPFERYDFSTLPASQRATEERAAVLAAQALGFKPHVAPLLRVLFVRHAPAQATLWLLVQNSLFDAWSAGILSRDLQQAYAALRGSQAPAACSVPAFGSFIGWLRQQPAEPAARFWSEQLTEAPLPPNSASRNDAEAPNGSAARYAEAELSLRRPSSERLRALARRLKLPLNVLIHALWAGSFAEPVAAAGGSRRSVLIGTVSSGRPAALPGVEDMVGLFSTVLPLRVHVTLDGSVREWLHGLSAALLALRDYEHCDLESIAKWSRLPVRALQHVLHRRSLVFLNTPDSLPSLDALAPFQLSLRGAQAHLDVALRAYVTPGEELHWKLRFDRAQVSEHDARALLARVLRLGEALPFAENVRDWLFPEPPSLSNGPGQ